MADDNGIVVATMKFSRSSILSPDTQLDLLDHLQAHLSPSLSRAEHSILLLSKVHWIVMMNCRLGIYTHARITNCTTKNSANLIFDSKSNDWFPIWRKLNPIERCRFNWMAILFSVVTKETLIALFGNFVNSWPFAIHPAHVDANGEQRSQSSIKNK